MQVRKKKKLKLQLELAEGWAEACAERDVWNVCRKSCREVCIWGAEKGGMEARK